MKINNYKEKLVTSIIITIILSYFMIKTTGPKIIFVPFLISSVSMAIKSIGTMLGKENLEKIFDKLFKAGFFLFWFGFLIFADYNCIKEKNYDLLIFSLLFWLVGIFAVWKIFFRKKESKPPRFNFALIGGAGLVIAALLAGIALLILGAVRAEAFLVFGGLFFIFIPTVMIIAYFTTFKK